MRRVNVAVRIRPLISREQRGDCFEAVKIDSCERNQVIANRLSFGFDYVHPFEKPQQDVYTETVQPLIENFLTGINSAVIAYGQTGSGKTYTLGLSQEQISVSDGTGGIAGRLLDDIFSRIREDQQAHYRMSLSFIEVYQEKIKDLLSPVSEHPYIIVCENGMIKVHGLEQHGVETAADCHKYIVQGLDNRSTAQTAMNDRSSRSHAILTLYMTKKQDPSSSSDGHCSVVSKFQLVDLAGSERQDRTHAEGSTFKEAVKINFGLLVLGTVISELANGKASSSSDSYIPYRDSKLTRLLQDCLGGNSRTILIACVSCSSDSLMETLNTLKYASRAMKIENRPRVNIAPSKTATIDTMKSEIAKLKDLLKTLHGEEYKRQNSDSCQSDCDIDRFEIIDEFVDLWNETVNKDDQDCEDLCNRVKDVEAILETLLDAQNSSYQPSCPETWPNQVAKAHTICDDSDIVRMDKEIKELASSLLDVKQLGRQTDECMAKLQLLTKRYEETDKLCRTRRYELERHHQDNEKDADKFCKEIDNVRKLDSSDKTSLKNLIREKERLEALLKEKSQELTASQKKLRVQSRVGTFTRIFAGRFDRKALDSQAKTLFENKLEEVMEFEQDLNKFVYHELLEKIATTYTAKVISKTAFRRLVQCKWHLEELVCTRDVNEDVNRLQCEIEVEEKEICNFRRKRRRLNKQVSDSHLTELAVLEGWEPKMKAARTVLSAMIEAGAGEQLLEHFNDDDKGNDGD